MNIKTHLANSKNYGGSRSLESIKYIVMHYTANDGDTDENNGKYFANNYVGASAHYFVDGDSVTQSVPDDRIAWHCGANYYRHPDCRNGNSIGIEICDERRNGVIYPTPETIENALELARYLMKKYNVPKENVIRHYDVTGKLCPAYWSGNAEKDALWKTEFWNKIDGKTVVEPEKKENEYYRVQVGAFSNYAGAESLAKELKAKSYGTYIVEIDGMYKVQVGAYNNKSGADEMVKKLDADGYKSFITTKVGNAVKENVQFKYLDRVMLQKDAPVYGTTAKFQNWVYNSIMFVRGVYNDRVVFSINQAGAITGAVDKKYLTKV